MTRHDRLIAHALRGPEPRVDVGADHAFVARGIGGIAVERYPHRRAGEGVPWVISDGLTAFRHVGTAVIAGMGADRIAGILRTGPRPAWLVAHAADDPSRLRRHLAGLGYRLVDECLAEEGRGYAEIAVAVPGQEPCTGVELDLGPLLLRGSDPLFPAWKAHQLAIRADLLAAVPPGSDRALTLRAEAARLSLASG